MKNLTPLLLLAGLLWGCPATVLTDPREPAVTVGGSAPLVVNSGGQVQPTVDPASPDYLWDTLVVTDWDLSGTFAGERLHFTGTVHDPHVVWTVFGSGVPVISKITYPVTLDASGFTANGRRFTRDAKGFTSDKPAQRLDVAGSP